MRLINTTAKHDICLTMIVRENNVQMIERCLRSTLPIIKCWAIVDTGSSPDVCRSIVRRLEGCRGVLHSQDWTGDFSFARNAALSLARSLGATHALTIDADDYLELDRHPPLVWADGHTIRRSVPPVIDWPLAIVRLEKPWIWKGKIHERLECPGDWVHAPLKGMSLITTREGLRASDPDVAMKDITALNAMLLEDENRGRTLTHLARTYMGCGKTVYALSAFIQRTLIRDGSHDLWFSHWMAALLGGRERLMEWGEIVSHYKEAMLLFPQRAEPYGCLAEDLLLRGRAEEALEVATTAIRFRPPEDGYLYNASYYEWRVAWSAAKACFQLEKWDRCQSNLEILIEKNALPAEQKTMALQMISRCWEGKTCQ